MKKFRVILMTVMILGSIGTAFATRPADYCEYFYQYYKIGNIYYPAGELGLDYICLYGPGSVCTYFLPNPVTDPNGYGACQRGYYYRILY